jgi:hypothetical protein
MIFVAISSIRIQIIYDMYVECALLLRSVHTLVLIQMRTLQNVTPLTVNPQRYTWLHKKLMRVSQKENSLDFFSFTFQGIPSATTPCTESKRMQTCE